MILYGFDPGEHIGFAAGSIEDGTFTITEVQEMSQKSFDEWCVSRMGVSYEATLVCEDYIIDPRPKNRGGSGYDHQWDKGISLRQIGALRLLCLVNNWTFEAQPNTRKPAGYGFLGAQYKRGAKGRHTFDAVAHLAFYGVKHKLWVPDIPEKAPEPISQNTSNRPKPRIVHHVLWRQPRNPSA